MYRFPIGIMLSGYKTDYKTAMSLARQMGLDGVQLSIGNRDFAVENMTAAKIAEIKDVAQSNGLEIVSVCGDVGKFVYRETNPALLEQSKRNLEITRALGCHIMTNHIGMIPADPTVEMYQVMQDAIREAGEFAADLGVRFAIETGPEPARILKQFLDSLDVNGVGVNLDPANLVMVSADDAIAAVYTLKDYIVHTHAKDGYQVKPCKPEYLYGVKQPVPEEYKAGGFYKEVDLGTGGVNFPVYLKALEQIGYQGYLTIEREKGNDPIADIQRAVDYLNLYLKG